MPRYTDDSRERVRDAVDMVDLVSARVELRRSGANRYTGLCPFHEERTPSFGIDPLKKVYHCFGCGAGGDVFKFVEETEGLDFGGALELLADRYGVTLEREQEDPQAAARRERRERLYALLERTADFYARYLWDSAEAADAREYLDGRGLGEEVLRGFRVGYAPSAWDRVLVASRSAGFSEDELYATGLAQRSRERGTVYDRFRARIMFPLCDLRGRVLGFGARALRDNQQPKYLNTSEGDLYHKGRQLFGADRARPESAKSGSVIVVEGYTDVLALHQAGLGNSVGLMGTAITGDQVAELARLAPVAKLALDADSAGQEAMLRAASLAEGTVDLRVVPLPPGDDPAEIVRRDGADALRALIENEIPLPTFRVRRILETAELGRSDARDAALDQIRDVLGALPAGVQRDELVRTVAGRLGLSHEAVASLAPPRGTRAASAVVASPGAGRALDRREQTERTFLAMCIALPRQGREALERVELEKHFTSDLVRRGAAHLREHLEAPQEGLDGADAELVQLIADLSLRAAREAGAEPAALEVETLQLEIEWLEREIATAQAAGRLDVPELAAARTKVKLEIDSALEKAFERGARP